PYPDELPGFRVACFDATDDTELATGHAGNDQPLRDERSRRVAIARGVVIDLFLPAELAGVMVERDELGVRRAEIPAIFVRRRAAFRRRTTSTTPGRDSSPSAH